MKFELTTGGKPDNVRGNNDCSVRALAIFLDVPYLEAEALIKAHCVYSPTGGCNTYHLHRLLRSLGLVYTEKAVRLTSRNPQERLPKQRAILVFSGHVAAYEAGVVYDSYTTTINRGQKQTHGWWTQP
jgi:hypothetical protein